jgi:Tfp pilus assembly protein PilO
MFLERDSKMAQKTAKNAIGSIKRTMIDKANTRLVLIVSIAAFAAVFSLVAAKTLWSQAAYQGRVISAKQAALTKLEANTKAMDQLKPSYDAFVGATTNAIGGNALGSGPKDGDNAKIILDALPSKYDFPALATNMETLVNDQSVQLTSISGTDDEVAQSGNVDSPNPQAVEMPFQLSVTTDYAKVQALVGAFEHSIRPIKIQTISLSGEQDKLTMNISAITYYQPAKSLKIRSEVVK